MYDHFVIHIDVNGCFQAVNHILQAGRYEFTTLKTCAMTYLCLHR